MALGFQNFRPVWFLYPLFLIIIILRQKLTVVWKISGEGKFSPVTPHNILFWTTVIFKMVATWAKIFTWIPARTRLADCLSNSERRHPCPDNNVQWLGNYFSAMIHSSNYCFPRILVAGPRAGPQNKVLLISMKVAGKNHVDKLMHATERGYWRTQDTDLLESH